MTAITWIFLLSSASLLLCVAVWCIESRRGRRLWANTVRSRIDDLLASGEVRLQRIVFWYRHLVFRLCWRSFLHTSLQGILFGLAYLYDFLLAIFERNLKAAKVLQRERRRWRVKK